MARGHRLIIGILSSILLLIGVVGGNAAAQSGEMELRERELGQRRLALGSWGADVFALQRHLRSLGFDLQADGLYGPKTRAAVRAFQERSGLTPTGVFAAAELEALNAALLANMRTMPYTVRPGDSLWSIARYFDTKMEIIVALNDLPDRPLRVGEVIQVPALATYTVVAGDTLSEIAVRFNTTVAELTELNGITANDILRVGTQLRLPRGAFALP